MQVSCPHCSTRYILPESLLGPLGARVRCPRCRDAFTVDPPAMPVAQVPAGATAGPPIPESDAPGIETPDWSRRVDTEPPPAPGARSPGEKNADDPAFRSSNAMSGPTPAEQPLSPDDVARAALDEIEAGSGEGVAEAWAQGHLFAEYGQAIAEAYETYRRRLGPGADPAAFRAALRERWGVDLEPGTPVTP